MRLRELTGETQLTISGKLTREIPLATQGERRQIAAGCLAKSGAQNGQKKKPGSFEPDFLAIHGHPEGRSAEAPEQASPNYNSAYVR